MANVPKTVPQKSPGPVSRGPVLRTQSNKAMNPKPVQESDGGLDPKLVEMINSVIVDRSPSVKWEDIGKILSHFASVSSFFFNKVLFKLLELITDCDCSWP